MKCFICQTAEVKLSFAMHADQMAACPSCSAKLAAEANYPVSAGIYQQSGGNAFTIRVWTEYIEQLGISVPQRCHQCKRYHQ